MRESISKGLPLFQQNRGKIEIDAATQKAAISLFEFKDASTLHTRQGIYSLRCIKTLRLWQIAAQSLKKCGMIRKNGLALKMTR